MVKPASIALVRTVSASGVVKEMHRIACRADEPGARLSACRRESADIISQTTTAHAPGSAGSPQSAAAAIGIEAIAIGVIAGSIGKDLLRARIV
jgi:hypothetical protein